MSIVNVLSFVQQQQKQQQCIEANFEDEPVWFDEVSDVEEALQTAWKFLGQMSISDLVGATRLVAKLAEAKAWGNIAGLAALQVDARLLGLI